MTDLIDLWITLQRYRGCDYYLGSAPDLHEKILVGITSRGFPEEETVVPN